MKITGALRHDQYMGFRGIAERLGFGRIRESELRTRVTVDPALQTAAADKEWTADFFGDAASAPVAERTTEPKLASGQAIPNEYLMCFPALTVEIDNQLVALTDTTIAEMLKKLGRAELEIRNGTDILFQKRIGYLISGLPAQEIHQGALAAGAASSIRSKLHKMEEGADFDDPMLFFPGASLQAAIRSEGTWVGATAVTVDLSLNGWIATKGFYAADAKVIGLAQAAAETLESLKDRAKVS